MIVRTDKYKETRYIMTKIENNRIIRLCGDIIFKSVFLKEKDILLKMIYDITNIKETSSYEEIIPVY